MENDQPATCMNLKMCFTYTGREVPGYIGKLLRKNCRVCINFKYSYLQNKATGI